VFIASRIEIESGIERPSFRPSEIASVSFCLSHREIWSVDLASQIEIGFPSGFAFVLVAHLVLVIA
jgi:hypothetical protein